MSSHENPFAPLVGLPQKSNGLQCEGMRFLKIVATNVSYHLNELSLHNTRAPDTVYGYASRLSFAYRQRSL
jgi:hypothetical protein